MHQDTWRMEDEVWSVLVAGYVLGYSLMMKSKNNDKTRVMIVITIITSMMSRNVVSTAPVWGLSLNNWIAIGTRPKATTHTSITCRFGYNKDSPQLSST